MSGTSTRFENRHRCVIHAVPEKCRQCTHRRASVSRGMDTSQLTTSHLWTMTGIPCCPVSDVASIMIASRRTISRKGKQWQ